MSFNPCRNASSCDTTTNAPGNALSEFCDPPLTTVSQPRFDIGREGMLLLLEQMQGHNVNSGSRLLDCELIVRGSTQKIRR